MRVAELAFVVGALMLGACLRPSLVECGELACAPTQVCHGDRCLDPAQLEACAGTPAGSPCDAFGEPGRCIDDVCEIATCGDGFVDEALREECDDSVPDAHCIDFGFDIGRPACTACQPDATMGCARFGWERIVDAPTTALSVDGDTIAYATTTAVTVRAPSGTTIVPGLFAGVHAAADRVIAYYGTSLVEIAGGVATPIVVPNVMHARIAPNGTTYVLSDCTVSSVENGRLTASLPPITADSSCALVEVGPALANGPRIYVAAGTPYARRVYRWDPNRNVFVAASPSGAQITGMRYHGDLLYVTTLTGAFTLDDQNRATNLPVGFGPLAMAFTDDAAFFGDANRVARVRGARVHYFDAPGLITGDTAVYSYRGPIYRFTGIDYGTREQLSPQLEVVSTLREPGGAVIVATKSAFHVVENDNWTTEASPAQIARAFAGAGDTYFVSDFSNESSMRAPVLYSTTAGLDGSWAAIAVPMAPLLYGLWWAPQDSTLFAVGDNDAGDAFLGVRRGTTMWETAYRTGCTVRGVHGTDSSHVIAVGDCSGRAAMWSYTGTQWTEHDAPDMQGPLLAALRFADGTLVVTGDHGTAIFDGTAWSIDTSVVGSALSGTAPDDVWVSGTFTSVQRFDGTVWSKLAVQANGPIAVCAESDRVLFPGATDGFVELVR